MENLQKEIEDALNDAWQHNDLLPNIEVRLKLTINQALRQSDVSGVLPPNYYFNNSRGAEVVILTTIDQWCVVREENKDKPYVLPLDFVMAIREGGNDR